MKIKFPFITFKVQKFNIYIPHLLLLKHWKCDWVEDPSLKRQNHIPGLVIGTP